MNKSVFKNNGIVFLINGLLFLILYSPGLPESNWIFGVLLGLLIVSFLLFSKQDFSEENSISIGKLRIVNIVGLWVVGIILFTLVTLWSYFDIALIIYFSVFCIIQVLISSIAFKPSTLEEED